MQLGDLIDNESVIAEFGEHKFHKSCLYNLFGKEMTGKSAICLFLSNSIIQNRGKLRIT